MVPKVKLHLRSHAKGIGDMGVHAGSVSRRQLAAVRLVRARSVQVSPLPQRPEHGLHRGIGKSHAHELAGALDADVRSWVHTVCCLQKHSHSLQQPALSSSSENSLNMHGNSLARPLAHVC